MSDDDLTTQERNLLYAAYRERDELRDQLAATERQLYVYQREAEGLREKCERLEGEIGAVRRMAELNRRDWANAETERDGLREKCERLEGALRQYGDLRNWGLDRLHRVICHLGPSVAEAALAGPDDKGNSAEHTREYNKREYRGSQHEAIGDAIDEMTKAMMEGKG